LGAQFKDHSTTATEDQDEWFKAQEQSENTLTTVVDKHRGFFFPLETTQKKNILDALWKKFDTVCLLLDCNSYINLLPVLQRYDRRDVSRALDA